MICSIIYKEFGDLSGELRQLLKEPSEVLPAKEKKDSSGLECTKDRV